MGEETKLPRRLRLGAVLAAAAVSALIAAPLASGSTGELTRAVATANWATASVAGWASWDGYEIPGPLLGPEPARGTIGYLPDCSWHPFATIGSGSTSADCTASGRRSPTALAPGVILAWDGLERRWAEAQSEFFEVEDVPLGGTDGQLVCLTAIETGPTKCLIGSLDWVCVKALPNFQVLAASLIAAPEEPPAAPAQPAPALALPAPEVGPAAVGPRKRCRKPSSSSGPLRTKRCAKRHGRQMNVSHNKEVPLS